MRFYKIAGHFFFCFLLLLAAIYYQERVIFIDSAYYLFNMLNADSPFVSGRPAGILPLLLPWIFTLFGISLGGIVFAYSIAFILLYWIIYWIACRMNSKAAIIAFPFIMLLCMRDTFYYASTEVHLSLAFTALLFASLTRDSRMVRHRILWPVVIIILCFLSHPSVLFPVSFLLLYLLSNHVGNFKRNELILLLFLLGILFLSSIVLSFFGSSEKEKFESAISFFNDLPDFFSLHAFRFLSMHTWQYSSYYLLFVILFIGLIIYQLYRKNFAVVILLLTHSFVFIAVNNSIMAQGESATILEKSLLPLSVYVAVPWSLEIAKANRKEWLLMAFVLLLLFGLTRRVSLASKSAEKRLDYLGVLTSSARSEGINKALIQPEEVDRELIGAPWALSIETLLKSTIDAPDSSVTLFMVQPEHEFDLNKETFLGPYFHINMQTKELNRRYFILPAVEYQHWTPTTGEKSPPL